MDLLTARYFQLTDPTNITNFEANAGQEHSGLSVEDLQIPGAVLTAFRKRLDEAINEVRIGLLTWEKNSRQGLLPRRRLISNWVRLGGRHSSLGLPLASVTAWPRRPRVTGKVGEAAGHVIGGQAGAQHVPTGQKRGKARAIRAQSFTRMSSATTPSTSASAIPGSAPWRTSAFDNKRRVLVPTTESAGGAARDQSRPPY
jgi:hypothetical protein